MNKILAVILVALVLVGGGYYLAQRENDSVISEDSDRVYTNAVYNYEFNYPESWEAVTSKFDSGEALFGENATSESGNGGVELMGELKSGQTLSTFVKEFNAGVESGSLSETPATTNGQPTIISIMSGPGNREVKSVAFLNGIKVFNVYIGYSPEQKADFTAKFDKLAGTFKFTKVDNTTPLTEGAQTYTSEALGVTFTYNPKPVESFSVIVTEKGNKIYLHGMTEKPEQGKMIEVFSKAANQTLAQAITEDLLKDYKPADCFAVDIVRVPTDPRPSSYSYAEISYPAPANSQDPFWVNGAKCPQPYSKTNAVQYFMANSAIPAKYVFLQLGQDSITDDGRVPGPDGNKSDWSSSIRIIK